MSTISREILFLRENGLFSLPGENGLFSLPGENGLFSLPGENSTGNSRGNFDKPSGIGLTPSPIRFKPSGKPTFPFHSF